MTDCAAMAKLVISKKRLEISPRRVDLVELNVLFRFIPKVVQSTNPLFFCFAEIADTASLSVEETGSSATESTDSIGSLRNSSPENAEKHVLREIRTSSDALSRLSPMVTGT